MKFFKSTSTLLFAGLFFTLMSCGGGDAEGSNAEGEGGEEEVTVMTTEEFIAEANELGYEEFEKKYPRDSEIELKGKVNTVATWSSMGKLTAKWGTSLSDLPLTGDFTFEANGGSKDSAKEKVKTGEEVHFKGKMGGSFFVDGKLNRVTFTDCIAQ